jgi:hypothetical protein
VRTKKISAKTLRLGGSAVKKNSARLCIRLSLKLPYLPRNESAHIFRLVSHASTLPNPVTHNATVEPVMPEMLHGQSLDATRIEPVIKHQNVSCGHKMGWGALIQYLYYFFT